MNIFNKLKQNLLTIAKNIVDDYEYLEQASIEIPKDPINGDLSTNIAMIIASKRGSKPREVGLKLKELMSSLPYIAHIEVAGEGFINFTIRANIWHQSIKDILSENNDFWEIDVGRGEKVNIEYVSANPTGPMHIGHARCAVYGDALAALLGKCGYKVTKEYYVNDAGSQINDLSNTVILRYQEAVSGKTIPIPSGLYPGEYLISLGTKLKNKFGDQLLLMDESKRQDLVKKFSVQEMLAIIKDDLKDLGIEHDVFSSEQYLHDQGKITEVVEILRKKGLIYQGQLPPPKGKVDEDWVERSQTLFKSSDFGDDQDRAVQKADGSWTYLAGDLAYAKDKIARGFDKLIYILGADHSGYVKRIKAVVDSLGEGKIKSVVKICQLVNFVENGIPVKMSKRAGTFTTVKDVTNEVGKDIIRFIMLTRKNDAPLDFDLAKVKEQSKENPIFYVQYANVRTFSILSNAKDISPDSYNKFLNNEFDISLLSSEEEIQLIKLLASWPKILDGAVRHFEPHRLAFYLINVAAKFHSMWNLGKENKDYRFIIEDDLELTTARLALAKAIQKIITRGFEIIGVTPLTKM